MTLRWTLLLLALATSLASMGGPAKAEVDDPSQCPADQSPILILGTYHMANPGLDQIGFEADDVLSERRQSEIATLLGSLERFEPTKVMVEAPMYRSRTNQFYAEYLQGERELGRNEVYQIGFRLAERSGLERLEPIDFPMWMNGNSAPEINYNPERSEPEEPVQAEPEQPQPRQPSEDELLLYNSTISEYLFIRNQSERIADEHVRYYVSLLEPDPTSSALYGRSDSLSNWYNRNFRMWTNVLRRSERPSDRIFLMVGSGHLAILRDLAEKTPSTCLVSALPYLE